MFEDGTIVKNKTYKQFKNGSIRNENFPFTSKRGIPSNKRVGISKVMMSDGTLWEGQIALYFRWTCLPDCAVPELDADYRRNNRRLS